MKKTYIIPTIQVVKFQPAGMIAGSLQYGRETEETSGNLSRDGDFWDDDDDY